MAETASGIALWVTAWPFEQWTKHAWAGAWVCSLFRNEGAGLSSDLIRDAVAATRAYYGNPPEKGFVTFVNTKFTRSPNPGYCYQAAGWLRVGTTKKGLPALQLPAASMPAPEAALGYSGPHRDAVGVDEWKIFA